VEELFVKCDTTNPQIDISKQLEINYS